ncbi:hypothetical protein IG193_08900 [Infirmifilum lucidum]|uniref:Uncharacterized protein n=1 Tax=Infirmifilum lucidum TaxID=2776706 RepID=A0A7L9FGK8_9CREN|nr:hypothetical protein [Infirmifilum lucidum]QOJ78847.1 hypothetical protein IG193_08900 [Infirmifilum lucidum]
MPYSGASRKLELLKWYLNYLYAWSTLFAMFAVYVHLYNRFKTDVGYSGCVWCILLEASTSPAEYFLFIIHVILLTAVYFGYDAEEGFEYVRYLAGTGRAAALALKLALVGFACSTPLIAAKVFMGIVWEPYAATIPVEMLEQVAGLALKLFFFSVYISSFAALVAQVLRKTSYTIWALSTYFYVFETINPYQPWSPLNAPYMYYVVVLPQSSIAEVIQQFFPNVLVFMLALAALYVVYSRGEVKWR